MEPVMAMSYEAVSECLAAIRGRLAGQEQGFTPSLAILCDLTLQDIVETLLPTPLLSLPYADLPGPMQRAEGRLLLGHSLGHPLLLLLGRIHPHDGFTLSEAGFPARLASLLGAPRLLLAVTTGSLLPSLAPGRIHITKDHINFTGLGGHSPLAGINDPRLGPRYFPLVEAYSPGWRSSTHTLASSLHSTLSEGVSAEVGAGHEVSPKEVAMLGLLGAAVMGRGCVSEVVTAVHAGVEVQVLALVTHSWGGAEVQAGVEVQEEGEVEEAKMKLQKLLAAIVENLGTATA